MNREVFANSARLGAVCLAVGVLASLLPASVAQPSMTLGSVAVGSDWRQTAKVTAGDVNEPGTFGASHAGVDFGSSVAVDGDVLVSGTAFDGAEDKDWVYIFERDELGGWEQVQKLNPEHTVGVSSGFGETVDVDADAGVIVVGDPGYASSQEDTGTVFVFERTSKGKWVETAQLLYPGEDTEDKWGANFGDDVAVDGGQIVVGAHRAPDAGFHVAGLAYVYERAGTGGWELDAELRAANPAPRAVFGFAVAIDAGTIVVGSSNVDKTHIFDKREQGWERTAVLEPRPAPHIPAWQTTCFGFDVAIDQDVLVIGEPCRTTPIEQQDSELPWSGSASIFERGAGGWSHALDVSAQDSVPGEHFGMAVAVSGNTVAAGAPDSPACYTHRGQVHLFERGASGWDTRTSIEANETSYGDLFGISMDLAGDTLVVGAPSDDNRRDQTPEPVADEGDLPPCVRLSGEWVFLACDEGEDAGSVFVFTRGASTGAGVLRG